MARRHAWRLVSKLLKIALWVVGATGLPTIITWAIPYARNAKSLPPIWWAIGASVIGTLLISWLLLNWVEGRLKLGISERYARSTEVEEVFRICRGFYARDDHVINRDSLQCFMSTSSRTVKIFEKDKQPVGLYIVFAINGEAVRKIRDGTIPNAQALNARHAVRDRGKPAGLYVTNICASGFIARGRAVESLKEDLADRIRRHRSIKYVFARMANDDGGRLIRKYGFKKIHENLPDQQVWNWEVVPRLPEEALR